LEFAKGQKTALSSKTIILAIELVIFIFMITETGQQKHCFQRDFSGKKVFCTLCFTIPGW
jgi:hypothetical protein